MIGRVALWVGMASWFSVAAAQPSLLDRLFSSDSRIENPARAEFAALPAAAKRELLPALLAALDDPDLRYRAVSPLAGVGPAARPGLREKMRSADATTRTLAVECLWMIQERPEEVVPSLVEALHDPDRRVRLKAASGFEVLGPVALPALPTVIEGLRTLYDERSSLIRAVDRMGPAATSAAPALLTIVSKPETTKLYMDVLRPAAIRALAAIQADPSIAGPVLVALLAETDSDTAGWSAYTLAALGDGGVPYLAEGLRSDNAFARRLAAEALRRMGTPSADAALAGFDEAERIRLEAEARADAARLASRDEALAPPPPTPEEGEPLTTTQTIDVPLGEGAGSLLLTAHKHEAERRADVLTIWRSSGGGYRRLARLRETSRGAAYTATSWRSGSRTFLHVGRTAGRNEYAWRLDRVWLVPETGPLRDVVFVPPSQGCGAWLPRIGTEEQLGARIDFTTESPRFGFEAKTHGDNGPVPPRWRGTFRIEGDVSPRLVVAGCADRD